MSLRSVTPPERVLRVPYGPLDVIRDAPLYVLAVLVVALGVCLIILEAAAKVVLGVAGWFVKSN